MQDKNTPYDLIVVGAGINPQAGLTADLALPGAAGDHARIRQDLVAGGLGERTAERLLTLYGGRAAKVAAAADDNAHLTAVIHEPTGAIGAELVSAVRHELARTLTDVLARRVLLAFAPGHGRECADAAARIVGDELGWSAERRAAELAEYEQWLTRLAVPVASGVGRAP